MLVTRAAHEAACTMVIRATNGAAPTATNKIVEYRKSTDPDASFERVGPVVLCTDIHLPRGQFDACQLQPLPECRFHFGKIKAGAASIEEIPQHGAIGLDFNIVRFEP